MTEWIDAHAAAQRLGVKRETLYTYVSRGFVTRRREGGESLFARSEIDALIRDRRHPGAPVGVLAMRSVRSAVSEVREGELFLRGVPLAELADEAYDDVVAHVLGPGEADVVEVPAHVFAMPLRRRLPAVSQWAGGVGLTAGSAASAARGLMAAAPTALGGVAGPTADAVFAALAGRTGSPAEVAALNTALVSLIDHGLASSVVAARVAASTRASAYDCLVAGYAALSGRLHGGIAPAALAVLRGGATGDPPAEAAYVSGFGHWRHPAGDPRADAVLARLALVDGAEPHLARLEELSTRFERRPNIDAALAALILTCRLPDDAGEVLFQLGRTSGLAAHVVEELDEDPLRWRATDPR